jgi:hypothetical protein
MISYVEIETFQDQIPVILADKTDLYVQRDYFRTILENKRFIRRKKFQRLYENWHEKYIFADQVADLKLKIILAELELELDNLDELRRKYKLWLEGKQELDVESAKKVPITDLYTGKIRKTGDRYMCNCPFHSETKPSMVIYPDNTYHCYGCGAWGDAIDFYMKISGVNFVTAVKDLT